MFVVGIECRLDIGFKQWVDPVSILSEDVQPEVGLQQLLKQVHSICIDCHTCTAAASRLRLHLLQFWDHCMNPRCTPEKCSDKPAMDAVLA